MSSADKDSPLLLRFLAETSALLCSFSAESALTKLLTAGDAVPIKAVTLPNTETALPSEHACDGKGLPVSSEACPALHVDTSDACRPTAAGSVCNCQFLEGKKSTVNGKADLLVLLDVWNC